MLSNTQKFKTGIFPYLLLFLIGENTCAGGLLPVEPDNSYCNKHEWSTDGPYIINGPLYLLLFVAAQCLWLLLKSKYAVKRVSLLLASPFSQIEISMCMGRSVEQGSRSMKFQNRQ